MELLKQLFEGVDGLSEDFHAKAATLFEANVTERVKTSVEAEMKTLNETFDVKLVEAVEAKEAVIMENLNKFLDATVAEWATENAVAIDNSIKVQIAEKMLGELKEMFVFNSIALPKVNEDAVVSDLQKQVADLGKQLEETSTALTESKQEALLRRQAVIVESAIKGLADTQAERVVTLAESIKFVDEADFKNKVAYIVEAVSGKNPFAKEDDKEGSKEDKKEDDKSDAKEDDKEDKKDDKVVESTENVVVKNTLIEQVLKIM